MSRHLPGLSDYDRLPDTTPQARQARGSLRGGAKTENLPLLGRLGGCWCGEAAGHYWPGKADGASHPSDRLELLSPPGGSHG